MMVNSHQLRLRGCRWRVSKHLLTASGRLLDQCRADATRHIDDLHVEQSWHSFDQHRCIEVTSWVCRHGQWLLRTYDAALLLMLEYI